MGRLSFNPLAHLDLLGTVMLFFGPFGWAKPVPVNPVNLRNPKKDMIWVALAGPLSNVVLGFLVAFLYTHFFAGYIAGRSRLLFLYLIYFNVGISFFNLLPIYPLDGSNIVRGFMKHATEVRYMHAMRFVPFIFIVMISAEWLLNVPVLSFVLEPLWTPYRNFLLDIYGVKALFLGL
ncbi:MAG: hypothetical protein A2350_05765 [Candidatus Raymondbacteria bacterium RifOxyB12_full_50_8]|nr:MAG: hypothetical protein A2350_05765 [Candidatus Raymondbacteria bacterium RifOxyB12_full_50_8]